MARVARLGAFIVLTLAVLAAAVFIIGSKEYLFHSTYRLKAQFNNVAGLAEGADVQVGGVHSGTVQSINLPHRPGERVTVLMNLDRSTHEIVKQDSVASIETEGMLGNQYVAISFGSAGQADVKDGQTIESLPPLVMAEMLQKASDILDSSRQAIDNATMATAHLKSVSAKIDSGQGTIGALVNDKQVYTNLQQTTSTLQSTIVQAQIGVTDFQENMEALKHNFILSGYFKKRGYEDAAQLEANSIAELPKGAPLKAFTFSARQLFADHDSAKLRNLKSLDSSGDFLASNQFGMAVVVVSAGAEGDSQKELVLTQARAMVIREYLVENFGFDDSQLKTLGLGKQTGAGNGAEWGTIRVLVYPAGTEVPALKPPQPGVSSASQADQPIQLVPTSARTP